MVVARGAWRQLSPPGCTVLAADKDDHNGQNGDDKKSGLGNPNCQPASP